MKTPLHTQGEPPDCAGVNPLLEPAERERGTVRFASSFRMGYGLETAQGVAIEDAIDRGLSYGFDRALGRVLRHPMSGAMKGSLPRAMPQAMR